MFLDACSPITYKSKTGANDLKIIADLATVASKPSKERKEIIEKTPIIETELHYLGQKDNDAYKRLKQNSFNNEPVKGEKGGLPEKEYQQTLLYLEMKIAEAKLGKSGTINTAKVSNVIQQTEQKAQEVQSLMKPNMTKKDLEKIKKVSCFTSTLVLNKAEFAEI